MTTQRSTLVTAIRAALSADGKPVGLTVESRRAWPTEASQLPLTMVGRMKETTVRANPASRTSPVVKRTLTIRLDHWATGADPEEALEPLLAWATAALLADPGFGGVALETFEESAEWDQSMLDLNFGHVTQTLIVGFTTKTTNQEQRQ